jgi:hypothetical protein
VLCEQFLGSVCGPLKVLAGIALDQFMLEPGKSYRLLLLWEGAPRNLVISIKAIHSPLYRDRPVR